MASSSLIARKAKLIKMILLDVDGVMTDGGLYYSGNGIELKRFHAHDGYAVVRAFDHGLKVGIITGRTSAIVDARAKALKITDVFQGAMDKVSAMQKLRDHHKIQEQEFAFIGDDLFDIPLLRIVGLSAAPRNARTEVRRAVDYVARTDGGQGVVREFIDLILKAQQKQPPR
jgi:3-deoxy-D-manno-octulosonate 8-phosphate phosphatase (KDO 8-P phosphatase)